MSAVVRKSSRNDAADINATMHLAGLPRHVVRTRSTGHCGRLRKTCSDNRCYTRGFRTTKL